MIGTQIHAGLARRIFSVSAFISVYLRPVIPLRPEAALCYDLLQSEPCAGVRFRFLRILPSVLPGVTVQQQWKN
jgi:hypothetical protein